MKSSLLIATLSAVCVAQTQTVRVVPVHLDPIASIPNTIQFFCTHNYDTQACLQHSVELQHALSPYPLERLGTWSFLLVPADDWRALVKSLRQNPVSPAFTIFDQRIIVLESSLFSATSLRNKELLRTFGVIGIALLDLAITHELGHSICQEKDERRANDNGRQLRQAKAVDCSKTSEGRSKIQDAFRLFRADVQGHRRGKAPH